MRRDGVRSSRRMRTLVTQMVQSRPVRKSERTRADIHDGPEQMLQSKAGYIDARPLTASSTNPLATHGRTIHPGQKRKYPGSRGTSVLPSGADIVRLPRHVRLVPEAELRRPARCSAGRKVRPAKICALGIRAQQASGKPAA